jgi:hypothetical protein
MERRRQPFSLGLHEPTTSVEHGSSSYVDYRGNGGNSGIIEVDRTDVPENMPDDNVESDNDLSEQPGEPQQSINLVIPLEELTNVSALYESLKHATAPDATHPISSEFANHAQTIALKLEDALQKATNAIALKDEIDAATFELYDIAFAEAISVASHCKFTSMPLYFEQRDRFYCFVV